MERPWTGEGNSFAKQRLMDVCAAYAKTFQMDLCRTVICEYKKGNNKYEIIQIESEINIYSSHF